jgi:hypothetical protein
VVSRRGSLGGDAGLLRLVWSFGLLTARQLTVLSGCNPGYLRARLARMVAAGLLRAERFGGATYVYRLGPQAGEVAPELLGGWAPPAAAARHALLAADLVVALVARDRPRVTGWFGEAELRVWPEPGVPIPDALVDWAGGRLWVEADRGTESQRIWQGKLARYRLGRSDVVLVSAPGVDRARRIANLAHVRGVALLAGTHAQLTGATDPVVFDATVRVRRPLSVALAASREGGR